MIGDTLIGPAELSPENQQLYDKAIAEVIKRRLAVITEELQAPKAVSGLTIPVLPRVARFRKICALSVGMAISAGAVFSHNLMFISASVCASFAILSSLGLGITMLAEILRGVGFDIQQQFVQGKRIFRRYSFQPSLNRSLELFGYLGMIVSGMVLGYAELYLNLSLGGWVSFSQRLDVPASFYFSLVTFATVGYGDLYPVGRSGRMLVSTEILASFCIVTVILAVSVSWVFSRQQELVQKRSENNRERMDDTERAMEKAQLGLYAGNSLQKEASELLESGWLGTDT